VSSKKVITFVLSWSQVSYKCIYYLPISVDVRKFPETGDVLVVVWLCKLIGAVQYVTGDRVNGNLQVRK
jgi:hypothetical protein